MSDCPAISVVVATKNRESSLQNLLLSLERQTFDHGAYEVIVVENGTRQNRPIVEKSWPRFSLVSLYEKMAGKSRALNRGLEAATGQLLAFTDDDVIVSPEWLAALYRGFLKYESATVFCGPIIPNLPSDTPQWLRFHRFADAMFARFEPALPEGPLPIGILPFGPNFALRSSHLSDVRFNLELGPSEENGPLFGEDVEFLQRFRDQSRQFIFLPDAYVHHYIAPEKTELEQIFERAFHMGRANVVDTRKPQYNAAESVTADAAANPDVERLERGALLNFYCGQMYQFEKFALYDFHDGLRQAIELLDIEAHSDCLSRSSRAFLVGGKAFSV